MTNYLLAALVLLFILVLFWDLLKSVASKAIKLILNSIAGLLILMSLNMFLGFDLPINWVTLLVCGIFGLPGVGTLIILSLFKVM